MAKVAAHLSAAELQAGYRDNGESIRRSPYQFEIRKLAGQSPSPPYRIRSGNPRAVLPIGHPLARKDRIKAADFHEQPFVALGAEILTRSETDLFLAAGNARPRIVAEAQLSASICELVANGAGVSIVEPVTAANFAAARRIIARPEQPFRYDLLLPALREPSSPELRRGRSGAPARRWSRCRDPG